MMRSTLLWLMSRSCQRATLSSAATALPRTTRARPVSRSQVIGLRLCGMALLCAAEFVVHERKFEAESCGLGVDAVAAADARGEHVFFRTARDDLPQFFGIGDKDFRAPDHLDRERSIDHVTAGQAKVEPPAR